MPPKRKQKRTPRRFNVRFRKVGEEDFAVGYTKNVSAGGLFVGTIRPFPPGTEIEVEIREAGELRHRPAVVVHAARVSPLLASVRTSGMGVRFRDRVEAVESGEECEMLGEGEPPGTETEEAVGRFGEEKDGTERVLQVDLSRVADFREAFRRDIQHGLIFAPTARELEVGSEVEVVVAVPGAPTGVALTARVDRQAVAGRTEAQDTLGRPGYMLILVDSELALKQLRAFL